MNQKPVQKLKKAISWEAILRLSDFHNITTIIYLGTLGMEKELSEDGKLQYYQSYKRELLLRESYHKAEEVIRWQLERHKIEALFLTDTGVEKLYDKPEMAYLEQVEILTDNKNLPQIHRLMRDMDYERQEDRLGNGIAYVRVPGIRIVFYDAVPIGNKTIRRYFSEPIRKYRQMENHRFMHILSPEEEYVYRIGRLVESYITGRLKIRAILDFWRFQKSLDETFCRKMADELVAKANWEEFAGQIAVLAGLWFEEGARQQYGLALELEECIISRGRENIPLNIISDNVQKT